MQENREERVGESLLEQIQRVQRKLWEVLGKIEAWPKSPKESDVLK